MEFLSGLYSCLLQRCALVGQSALAIGEDLCAAFPHSRRAAPSRYMLRGAARTKLILQVDGLAAPHRCVLRVAVESCHL